MGSLHSTVVVPAMQAAEYPRFLHDGVKSGMSTESMFYDLLCYLRANASDRHRVQMDTIL
jgi:hypothetical protein